MYFFMFCTKFCITKIVKCDFFGTAIIEKYIAFHDRDMLNLNPDFILIVLRTQKK